MSDYDAVVASSDVAVRPRRSAFAAAFLSFIVPGLGHAYLGRWLRALLWAALPILALAALGGLALSPDRREYLAMLADPDVLLAALVILGVDLIYRLLALLDAYRLATDPTVGSAGTRLLSSAGLVAIIIVLLVSHIVAAQPIFLVTDTLEAITENAGDESEIADLEQLAAENQDFVLNFEGLEPLVTADPAASPGTATDATPAPTLPPPPSDLGPIESTAPEVEAADWDGRKRLNILLIGADGGRAGLYSYLTDTMIVVSIDPPTGRVAFISLPRDTAGIPLPRSWPAYSAFGGAYNNKINTLYTVARGRPDLFPGNDKERGFTALMGALGELYGLDIDYYVAVDLDSFRSVVNTLGGVVVDVQLPVYDDGYPSDDGRGKLKLYVPPGVVRMNGQQALAYARSRHGSSDFDRSARQQRVITSVRDQTDLGSILEPGVLDALIKQVRKDVKTNIPPKLVPALLSLAQDIDLDRRENLVLSDSAGYSSVCYPCGPSGLWMLKAKPSLIRQAAQDVFSDSRQRARSINRLQDEGAVVHVLNGQGGSATKALGIAAFLSEAGIDATVPPVNDGRADSNDYEGTVITVYNGAGDLMPETLQKVKRSFKDKGAQVTFTDDPEQEADIVVVVGSKTAQLKP
jgi:LCP family protein required for cell wall assembly